MLFIPSKLFKLSCTYLIFGVAYYFFALNNPADATVYWNTPKDYGFGIVQDQLVRGTATGYIFLIN